MAIDINIRVDVYIHPAEPAPDPDVQKQIKRIDAVTAVIKSTAEELVKATVGL